MIYKYSRYQISVAFPSLLKKSSKAKIFSLPDGFEQFPGIINHNSGIIRTIFGTCGKANSQANNEIYIWVFPKKYK